MRPCALWDEKLRLIESRDPLSGGVPRRWPSWGPAAWARGLVSTEFIHPCHWLWSPASRRRACGGWSKLSATEHRRKTSSGDL